MEHASKIDDVLRVENWYSITVFPQERLAIAKFVCEIDILAIPVTVGERGKQFTASQTDLVLVNQV